MWSNFQSNNTKIQEKYVPKSTQLSIQSNALNHHKKTILYNKDNIVYDLFVVEKTDHSVTISFSLKPNIKNYKIIVNPSENNTFYESFSQSNSETIIKTIDNLRFGTMYNIKINAIDYFDVNTIIEINVKTLQPPTYPTNINFINITNSTANIIFTPPPQEIITYKIFIYLDSDITQLLYERDFSANQLNRYPIDGLSFHTRYYITIQGINPDGISTPSIPVSFITTQSPDLPSNLIKTGQTTHSIDISFEKPLQYVEYFILIINSIETINIPGNTNFPYTITNLDPNTLYNFKLFSYNSDGTSSYISLNNNYTLPIINNAIFGIITNASIELKIINSFYDYFNIKRNTIEISTNNIGNTWLDNNVIPNTLYNYEIIPYNENPGNSYIVGSKYTHSFGNIKPITYNTNYNQLQINWQGAYSTVNVERNSGGIFTPVDNSYGYPASDFPSNNISGYVIDSGLLANTLYSYKVTLKNNDNIPFVISYDIKSFTLANISNAIFGDITTNSIKIINIIGNYKEIEILRILKNKYITLNTNNTNYNDTGLLPNTRYEYQIIPYNNSYTLSPKFIIGNTVTRPVFSNASFGNYTAFSIHIIGFTGSYNRIIIKRLTNIIDISNNTDTSYNDTGLSPNTLYTYNITPYNINDLSGTIYNVGSLYTKTNGQINPITYINTDSTKLQINWNGIYSSVSITRNNGGVLTPDISLNYNSSPTPQQQVNGYLIDRELNPNTNYSYTVSLLNNSGIPSIITNDIHLITPPIITDASFGNISNNSIEIINIKGAYDHIMVYRKNGTGTYVYLTTITQNNLIDSGLLPNNLYNYQLIPYNVENKEGATFTIGPKYTLPIITDVSFGTTTNNSIQIQNISGSYQYIEIYRNPDIYITNTTSKTNIIDNGLLPNYLYSYSIIPYNIENKAGTTFITTSLYTDSSGIFVNFTNITSSQIQINWSGIDSSAQLIRNPGSVVLNTLPTETPQTNTIYNLIDSGLNPNTTYSYNIYLYNGNNKMTNISSLSTATTLSTIESANYQNITKNSVKIVVSNTNQTYKRIQVYRNNIVNPVGTITYPDTSFNDTGLIPNNVYSYSLVSYNTIDVSSVSINLSTVKTYPFGTISNGTNITSSQIQINWSGYYNYISILRKNDNNVIMTRNNNPSLIYNNSSDFFTDIGLAVNTIYTYTITLYNDYNGDGVLTILNDVSFVTLPNVNAASFGTITINSINIQSILGNFQYCKIKRNTGEIYTIQKTDTSYNNTGLTVNTSYSYILTPFNIVDFSGSSLSIGPIYTLPSITVASYGIITQNSIRINSITGNYYKIDIYRILNAISNKVGSIINDVSFTDINLTPNNLYNYNLIPFNLNNTPGNSYNLNQIYTLASGTIQPCSNITSSQIQINWIGYDSSVNVVRNINGTIIKYTNNTYSINTTGNVIDTGLNPNTNYSYTVNLYNGNDISYVISTDISATTLSNITAVSYTNITENSVQINMTGSYSRIVIDRIVGEITYYETLTINNPTNNILDTGLIPNTQYNYILTSYNTANQPSIPLTVNSVCTLPKIGSVSFGTVTTQSINIIVTNSFFNRIDISYGSIKIGSITYPNTSFTHTGLTADMIYTYSLTPYNIVGNIGSSVNTGTKYTLPTIQLAELNNITSNSMKISITNANYRKIDISYGLIKIGNITYPDTSFNYTGLNPNSNYMYYLTPFNGENINGFSYTLGTDQTYTKARGSFVSIVNTSEGIKISWSGTYYRALVTGNLINNIMISTTNYLNYPLSNNFSRDVSGYIIDTNILPNSNYSYTIKLYNNKNDETIIPDNINIYSTPVVYSNYGNIRNNSIELLFSGSYNKINILKSWGSSQTYSFDISNTFSSYIDSGLSNDTSYNYRITPYAVDNTIVGNPVTLGVKYTLGNITSASYGTITSNSIQINNIVGNYNYISVNRGSLNPFIIYSPATSFVDPVFLMSDTSYNYSLTPYNYQGFPGNVYSMPIKYTLGYITTANFGTITNNSINLQISGIYTTLIIKRIINGSTIDITTLTSTQNTLTDNSNNSELPANTSIQYSLTPQNKDTVSSTPTIIGPRYTYSTGVMGSFTNITKDKIQINWTGIYSTVSVIKNTGPIQPDTSSNYTVSITPQQNVTGFVVDKNLNINTTYYYSLYLYNGNNVSTTISTDISATTLPNIEAVTYISKSTNSIRFSVTDGSYNTVSIQRIDESNNSYIFTSSLYTITDTNNILPNRKYRYNLTPKNVVNASGTEYQLGIVCTLPIITNVQKQQIPDNKIQFTIDGSFNTFQIYLNGTINDISNSNPYIYSLGSTSTTASYSFSFVPYNKDNDSGQTYSLNPIFLDAYASASYDNSKTTKNSVTIDVSGNYKYIIISNTGDSSTDRFDASSISFTKSSLNPNQTISFTVTPYNINNNPSSAFNLGSITTLPLITGADYGNIRNNSIEIKNIVGYYKSFKLNRTNDGISFVTIPTTSVQDSSYTDTGLSTNRSYYYTITPFNTLGNIGENFTGIQNKINTYNLSTGYIFTSANGIIRPCSDISHNQMKINWNGTYTNALVSRNNGFIQQGTSFNYLSSQNPTQDVSGYIFDTGLNPNTRYYYTVTLKNGDGIGNIISSDVSAVTLSYINSFDLQPTYNSMKVNNINSTNGYSRVVITRTGGSSIDFSFNTTDISGTDPSILNSNRQYTYSLVPYNSQSVPLPGQSISSSSWTLSYINSVTVTAVTYNDISINISRTDLSYITVNISSTRGTNNTNIYSNNYLTTNSNSIDCSGLPSNTNYTISMVPYNNMNINGLLYSLTSWTLSNINSFNLQPTYNSMKVNNINAPNGYSRVVITRTGGSSSDYSFNTTDISGTDPSVLNSNRQYTYSLVPYNSQSVPVQGQSISSSSWTLSYISQVTVTNKTYNDISINITRTDLSYIEVIVSNDRTTTTNIFSNNYLTSNSNSIDCSGLLSNTNYTITVVPYNNVSVNGLSYSITSMTLSDISNVTFNNYIYSLELQITSTDLSYISVFLNESSTPLNYLYNQIQGNIMYNNLLPNTQYRFSVKPYNNVGNVGSTYNVSTYTLSDLSNLIVTSSNTAYGIDLSFTYTDLSYITIVISDISYNYKKNEISLPLRRTGLIPNTNYSFYVTPYNNISLKGTTNVINSSTVSEITNLSLSLNIYQIDISFSYASDVSYVKITRTNGTNIVENTYSRSMLSSMPITQTGLMSDTSYSLIITPYSNLDQSYNKYYFDSLTSYTTNLISTSVTPYPIYTLSDVSNLIVTSDSANQIDISFTYTDISYVIINYYHEYSFTIDSIMYYKPLQMPITKTGFNPNSIYNISVTPYNDVNTEGFIRSISTTTKYDISNIIISNISTTSMDISFIYASDISYVKITKIGDGTTNTTNNYINTISLPIRYTGLTNGSIYSFVLSPYNNLNVSYSNYYYNGSTFSNSNYIINNSFLYNDFSLNRILQNNPPYGIYDTAMWNNISNILPEARGFGYDASGNNITNGITNIIGNGAVSGISYMSGNTTSKITWPIGSIPSQFTICSISRYSGSQKKQILQSKYYTNNWFHGHNNGNDGLANYDLSKSDMTYNGIVGDWLVMCGKNDEIFDNNGLDNIINSVLANSVPVGISFGGSGGEPYQLCINNTEASDWNLSYVMIWDTVLDDTDMLSVSNAFKSYLTTGKIYKTINGVYTLSTVSNLIAPNITTSTLDISFNYSDLSYVYIESNPAILTGGNTTPATISKASISLPIKYSGLNPDISYNFKITPYNQQKIVGANIINSFTTLSTVSNLIAPNITTSTIDISFNYSDLSYVYIESIPAISTGGNLTPATISKSNIILPIKYSELSSDTIYNFTITPYNHANLQGFDLINSFRTLTIPIPSLSSVSTNNITYRSVDISFDQTNVSYIMISKNNGIATRYNNTTSPITITSLLFDTSYNFSLTPYNNSDVSGTTINTSQIRTSKIISSSTNATFSNSLTNYYLYTFTSSGDITFDISIYNSEILLVGGGGGGGIPTYNNNTYSYGGGGNSANIRTLQYDLNKIQYTITIGQGGGSNTAGNSTTISPINVSAFGGAAGGNVTGKGQGGYTWIINSASYSYNGSDGFNSAGIPNYPNFNNNNNLGGGVGALYTDSTGNYFLDGKSATVYGSGGGGAGLIAFSESEIYVGTSGGSGANGILIIAIPK